MPGVGYVRGEVIWETRAPDGHLLASGEAHNLYLDQGRSAYVGYLRFEAGGPPPPAWLYLGTGSAAPLTTDTALQYRVTAVSASAKTVVANFTARHRFSLGATQMTGLITELLLVTDSAHPTTAYAKATVSANHGSGSTFTISWLEALLV